MENILRTDILDGIDLQAVGPVPRSWDQARSIPRFRCAVVNAVGALPVCELRHVAILLERIEAARRAQEPKVLLFRR